MAIPDHKTLQWLWEHNICTALTIAIVVFIALHYFYPDPFALKCYPVLAFFVTCIIIKLLQDKKQYSTVTDKEEIKNKRIQKKAYKANQQAKKEAAEKKRISDIKQARAQRQNNDTNTKSIDCNIKLLCTKEDFNQYIMRVDRPLSEGAKTGSSDLILYKPIIAEPLKKNSDLYNTPINTEPLKKLSDLCNTPINTEPLKKLSDLCNMPINTEPLKKLSDLCNMPINTEPLKKLSDLTGVTTKDESDKKLSDIILNKDCYPNNY